MPGVLLNEDDYNFDIALRRFKKQVEKAGILSEMKKRQHFAFIIRRVHIFYSHLWLLDSKDKKLKRKAARNEQKAR